jgi:2-polyprenyl-3-methyl-5-hydroxy-6-metoxy-1,4-benzoquinol methylase
MKESESAPGGLAGRYARVIDPEAADSLALLVRWIRPGSTVLDVGTASGALGRFLREHRQCVLDGVERDLASAALARRHYRRLVIADLDRSGLASLAPAGAYDYVVCADVLEHLREPLEVLRAARGLLREGGHLLISIPNVAYAPLLAELLGGQLRYRPVGLLDESHLHFVTRASLEQMVEAGGFALADLARVVKPPHESEFDSRYLEALPPAVRGFLEQAEEAYTYQLLVDAVVREQQAGRQPAGRAIEPARASSPPASPRWPLPLRFVARLYWRSGDSPYEAGRQVEVLGEIGAGLQTLRFTLPPETGKVAGLLLELTDRETILELRGLRVHGPAGRVWDWSGSAEELRRAPHERMDFVERSAPGTGVQALILAREPRLELPLGGEALARCEGGCAVEAEVSWPPSPEYMQVLGGLQDRFEDLAAAQDRLAEMTAERDRLGLLLDERLRLLRETEKAWKEAVADRDRLGTLLDERLRLLQATEKARQEAVADRDRLGLLLDERLRLLQEAEQAWQEAVADRDRLGLLLDERLRLLQEAEQAWQEAVADRDRLGLLLDERLRLLQEAERAGQEAVQERDRAVLLLDERLALLQAFQRQIEELEAERKRK